MSVLVYILRVLSSPSIIIYSKFIIKLVFIIYDCADAMVFLC